MVNVELNEFYLDKLRVLEQGRLGVLEQGMLGVLEERHSQEPNDIHENDSLYKIKTGRK